MQDVHRTLTFATTIYSYSMCKFTKHEKSNGSLNGWTEDFCYLELYTKIKVIISGFVYIFNACADLNFPAELYDAQFGPKYLSENKRLCVNY